MSTEKSEISKTLTAIPGDVFYHHLLPFLKLSDLLRLSTTSKETTNLVAEYLETNTSHYTPKTFEKFEAFLAFVKKKRQIQLHPKANTKNTEQKELNSQEIICYNLKILNLSQLSCDDRKRITNKHIWLICVLFPHLTELNLDRCSSITDESMFHIARNLNLKRLNLKLCNEVTNAGLELLALSQKRLTHLNLERCHKVTNMGLEYLASNLQQIEFLSLAFCKKINVEGIILIANSQKAITHLDLRFVLPYVTSYGWLLSPNTLQKLVYLNITGCSKLSPDHIEVITTQRPHLTLEAECHVNTTETKQIKITPPNTRYTSEELLESKSIPPANSIPETKEETKLTITLYSGTVSSSIIPVADRRNTKEPSFFATDAPATGTWTNNSSNTESSHSTSLKPPNTHTGSSRRPG